MNPDCLTCTENQQDRSKRAKYGHTVTFQKS